MQTIFSSQTRVSWSLHYNGNKNFIIYRLGKKEVDPNVEWKCENILSGLPWRCRGDWLLWRQHSSVCQPVPLATASVSPLSHVSSPTPQHTNILNSRGQFIPTVSTLSRFVFHWKAKFWFSLSVRDCFDMRHKSVWCSFQGKNFHNNCHKIIPANWTNNLSSFGAFRNWCILYFSDDVLEKSMLVGERWVLLPLRILSSWPIPPPSFWVWSSPVQPSSAPWPPCLWSSAVWPPSAGCPWLPPSPSQPPSPWCPPTTSPSPPLAPLSSSASFSPTQHKAQYNTLHTVNKGYINKKLTPNVNKHTDKI